MLSKTELNYLKNKINLNTELSNKNILFKQALNLQDVINDEVKNFDENKNYYDICVKLKETIEIKYLYYLPDILDLAMRLYIHEIYLIENEPPVINVLYEIIIIKSQKNCKHFLQAQEIAQKILKIYYLTKSNGKKIIELIDEFLPDTYVDDDEISLVIWYFMVCITSYYNKIKSNQSK